MNNPTERLAGKSKHNLILTSCLYPPDLLRQRIAFRMMDKIADAIEAQENNSTINTLLFAGDSIYADASAGILDPSDTKERFGSAYDRLKEAQSWQTLNKVIDHRFHTIDDHEIIDNWEPAIDAQFCEIDGCSSELMEAGKEAFYEFTQGSTHFESSENTEHTLWGRRCVDGLNIFLLDTRTERQARSAANSTSANIFDDEQETALISWLDELHELDLKCPSSPPTPKFIMSGSMILPRRINAAYAAEQNAPTLQSDSWDGYPNSRENLLSHIAEKTIKNVVLLSGDEHLPVEATIHLTTNEKTTTVYSLHGSPMWAPFEFANTDTASLMKRDIYKFPSSTGFQVVAQVSAEFPPVGNGFLQIEVDLQSPTKLSLAYVGDRKTQYKELSLCTIAKPDHKSVKTHDTRQT